MPPDLALALTEVMVAIHARGWCDGTGGNFSCVRQTDPLQLLMAPSGVDKGSLAPGDLILVDGEGVVIEGEGRASAETLLHLEIVRRTGAGAVLHTHSQAATLISRLALQAWTNPSEGPTTTAAAGSAVTAAVTMEGLEMLKGLDGVTTHASQIVLPVLPNDQDLARLSRTASPLLPGAPHGLLIGGHGLYAWGRDLLTARRHLEILEFLLEQRWRELLLGVRRAGDASTSNREPKLATRHQATIAPLSHILLDIEGTTCPVSFVAETLFPYARDRLETFLLAHATEPQVLGLLEEIQAAWSRDDAPEALALQTESGQEARAAHLRGIAAYLRWLIATDRKLTPLKELQGLIWEAGYRAGDLVAPLFEDVPEGLDRWHRDGLALAVYSSGSVAAQQLLYGHSNAGDLRSLFSAWFDTRSGAKQEASSYTSIAASLSTSPDSILFISDSLAEVEAASRAGLQVLFSDRSGNPGRDPGPFPSIRSFRDLRLLRRQPLPPAEPLRSAPVHGQLCNRAQST